MLKGQAEIVGQSSHGPSVGEASQLRIAGPGQRVRFDDDCICNDDHGRWIAGQLAGRIVSLVPGIAPSDHQSRQRYRH